MMDNLLNGMRAVYAKTEHGTKSFDEWYIYQHQMTQEEAGYDSLGMKDNKACANCQFFHSPDGCLIVSGDISPTGMSKFWNEKVKYQPDPIPVFIVDVTEGVKATTEPKGMEKITTWLNGLMGRDNEASSLLPVGLRPIYFTPEDNRVWMFGSNNFEDRHGHYIKESTQQEYIEWAADHPELLPEFHIWHQGEKTKWGKADTVARINNFTLWSGLVDKGFEPFAEACANDPNICVSNGYFAVLNEDNTEFDLWRPYELSPLPLSESANVWMGTSEALRLEGYVIDEGTKALLKQRGASEEFLADLDKYTGARGTQVTNAGVGAKSVEDPPTPGPTDPPKPEEPVVQQANSVGGTVQSITMDQIVGALATVIAPISQRIEAIEQGQKSLEGKVAKTQEDLVAEQLTAQISQAAQQGYKASEDPKNIVEENKDLNWIAADLEKALASGGLNIGGR